MKILFLHAIFANNAAADEGTMMFNLFSYSEHDKGNL